MEMITVINNISVKPPPTTSNKSMVGLRTGQTWILFMLSSISTLIRTMTYHSGYKLKLDGRIPFVRYMYVTDASAESQELRAGGKFVTVHSHPPA